MLTMLTFSVLNTPHLFNLIFLTCLVFEQFSSLKFSLEKPEVCWIGSARCKQDKPVDCNWVILSTDKICTLGSLTAMIQIWLTPTIFFGYCEHSCESLDSSSEGFYL